MKYNFGAVSKRCDVIYGAERPGYVHLTRGQPSTPRGPDVDENAVKDWIEFMLGNGIKRVLCLLTKEELQFYSKPLLQSYADAFGSANVMHVDVANDCQLFMILSALTNAYSSQEKIIVHCSTGQSRTANVLALWLHRQYVITISNAVNEVVEFSIESKTTRRPKATEIIQWLLGPGQHQISALNPPPPPTSGTLSSRTISRPNSSRISPRGKSARFSTDENPQVCFIQMGGTIDRRGLSTSYYGELVQTEIGDSCVREILTKSLCTTSYEIVCVSKKEGSDINENDQKCLITTLFQTKATRVIVTHSLESILSTAQFVNEKLSLMNKVIIFTGAMIPAISPLSDASFAIGYALGISNYLKNGVYISVHDQVIPASNCVRNEQTGFFQAIK
ncbi:L-asparaginase [Thraustotheca clavata]|uniref:L-asparaginase n=1 Tax=Thraustotheca clavata TaxID=74557 RepID=A0A1V9ZZQ5_9STRA|nr:L-asparaginase [Thraustotheca clavata]